jgi:hypothetical protein
VEGVDENGALLRTVEWASERITHREVHKYAARWPHLSAQVTAGRYHHSRDAGLFDHARYQTNGLVIERSSGDKN